MTQYMNLSAHAYAGQCAHQASSCASFGFLCSAFFCALRFFLEKPGMGEEGRTRCVEHSCMCNSLHYNTINILSYCMRPHDVL